MAQRIRAARAVAAYFRAQDPDTVVTEHMIRGLMASGKIPTFRNGSKILTSLEAVEAYLEEQLQPGGRS